MQMDALDVKNVLTFLRLVNSLKHSVRKGWEYRGVPNSESIASHMYSMGIMTFLLGSDSKLDRFRCLQLTLVHDLAESIVGDITPVDNVPVDVKHQMEDVAMQDLTADLGEVGKMIYELYKEYDKRETEEAKFVKDLDRFDMIFTAAEYERQGRCPKGRLQEFFDSTHGKFENPFVQKLVAELEHQRNCA